MAKPSGKVTTHPTRSTGAEERKALLTGADVTECPACLDLGEHRYFTIEQRGGMEVRCSAGHRYTIRSWTRWPGKRDTFELISRVP